MRTKTFPIAVAAAATAVMLGAPTAFANHVVIKATSGDGWTDPDPQADPEFTHVTPGTRVVWRNPARLNATHDVTAYGRNWDKRVTLRPGESTAKRFRNTGTYKYRCRLHSQLNNGQCDGMCGVIHVAR